ncbi:hypothetical protein [Corallococcus sicarius]|uniref:Lipoprotein n=1 Tax=Corallococcus sicarius TaxID=2316726 RepID=A0A3A8NWJ5_9BACT|nr:hypothetical protein [Corallococcus sicarius]RKH43844.1 hypothetical protein D7X12_12180 [Corallococcus sicarius]
MKPLFVAASLALGLCACTESPPVVQILQSKQPNAECVIATDGIGIARGGLNLAYARSYRLGLVVNSVYANTPIEVSGVPLDPAPPSGGQATLIVDTLKLSYEVSSGASIPSQDVPFSAGLNGASEGNLMLINLFTAESSSALRDAVPSNGEPVQVKVTLQFTGKAASGGAAFESNEFVYAIDVENTPLPIPACGAAEEPEVDAPCGAIGQDGAYPSCLPT